MSPAATRHDSKRNVHFDWCSSLQRSPLLLLVLESTEISALATGARVYRDLRSCYWCSSLQRSPLLLLLLESTEISALANGVQFPLVSVCISLSKNLHHISYQKSSKLQSLEADTIMRSKRPVTEGPQPNF
jgi:hypothetical protein